jgi:hypothetical protein
MMAFLVKFCTVARLGFEVSLGTYILIYGSWEGGLES